MELEYIRNGDYYIPNLTIQKEERSIGKWGRMHREFLREHHLYPVLHMVIGETTDGIGMAVGIRQIGLDVINRSAIHQIGTGNAQDGT